MDDRIRRIVLLVEPAAAAIGLAVERVAAAIGLAVELAAAAVEPAAAAIGLAVEPAAAGTARSEWSSRACTAMDAYGSRRLPADALGPGTTRMLQTWLTSPPTQRSHRRGPGQPGAGARWMTHRPAWRLTRDSASFAHRMSGGTGPPVATTRRTQREGARRSGPLLG